MLLQPKRNKNENQRGVLLIEVVVIVAIIVGSLVAILGLATMFLTVSHVAQQTSQATVLAQEALEIVRNYRDGTHWSSSGLGQIALGSAYHPEQSGSPPSWTLVLGSETIGGFTRQIVFEQAFRDANDTIAQSGNSDPDTMKAVVEVSWQERGNSHTMELQGYFMNWNQ